MKSIPGMTEVIDGQTIRFIIGTQNLTWECWDGRGKIGAIIYMRLIDYWVVDGCDRMFNSYTEAVRFMLKPTPSQLKTLVALLLLSMGAAGLSFVTHLPMYMSNWVPPQDIGAPQDTQGSGTRMIVSAGENPDYRGRDANQISRFKG